MSENEALERALDSLEARASAAANAGTTWAASAQREYETARHAIRDLFAELQERPTWDEVREALLIATNRAVIDCPECRGVQHDEGYCHICNGCGAVGLVADAILAEMQQNREPPK